MTALTISVENVSNIAPYFGGDMVVRRRGGLVSRRAWIKFLITALWTVNLWLGLTMLVNFFPLVHSRLATTFGAAGSLSLLGILGLRWLRATSNVEVPDPAKVHPPIETLEAAQQQCAVMRLRLATREFGDDEAMRLVLQAEVNAYTELLLSAKLATDVPSYIRAQTVATVLERLSAVEREIAGWGYETTCPVTIVPE